VALRGDAALHFGVEEPKSLMAVAVVQRLGRDFWKRVSRFRNEVTC
jgi:hypothetical protein